MKKFISLIIAFQMICVSSLISYAEDDIVVRIEAENYSVATVKTDIYDDAGFSEGKSMGFNWFTPDDDEYLFEYSVNVPKTGLYSISAVGTERDVSNTTDWSVYVNSPDNAPDTYSKSGEINTQFLPEVFKSYNLGEMKLKKGINKVFISIDGNDVNQYGSLISVVDYVQFKMNPNAPFVVQKVRFKDNYLGVYENGKNVELKFEFNKSAEEEQKFSFEIVDLWERSVADGDFYVRKGADEAVLDLGKFKNGWYRIYLKDEHNVEMVRYLAFSVVHPLSSRTVFEDTSWGSDIAMEYDATTEAHVVDYARALKLAGLNYARTRGSADWQDSYPAKEYLHSQGISEIALHDLGAVLLGNSASAPDNYMMISDLSEIAYNRWKNITNVTAGYVEAVEALNEGDMGFGDVKSTGDLQASYYKASMIGMSDAKVNPIKTYGGWAGLPSFTQINILRNGILNYADVYNYHQHGEIEQRTSYAKAFSIAHSDPESELLPLWSTESGLSQNVDNNNVVIDMKQGVRHAVTSAVTTVAYGCSKNFYFLTRPYTENGNNFSCWHTDHLPFPMYSALSTYTYELGLGKYKGELTNIPEGVTGYLFDNGEGDDVACVWSPQQNYINVKAKELKYVDMVGYEEIKKDTDGDGIIKILVSEDPVFIHFNGRYGEENYYKQEYGVLKAGQKTFEPHERIVLQQIWEDFRYNSLADVDVARQEGYHIGKGESETVRLKVYNFNDKPMNGTINAISDGPIILDKESADFSIEPWGQTEIEFNFTVTDEAMGGMIYSMKFGGVTSDNEELCPTIANFKIKMGDRVIEKEDMVMLSGAVDADMWSPDNRAEGSTMEIVENTEEQSLTFKVTYNGLNWSFPLHTLSEADRKAMVTSSGLVFDRVCTEDTDSTTTVYLYTADGRNYFSGFDSAVPYTTEKQQLIFPWSDFSLYHSPLGAYENRPFRLEDIVLISIGNSGGRVGQPMPEVTISNVAFFTSDNPADKIQQAATVEVSGIEDGMHYSKEAELEFSAKLPEGQIIESKRLIINDTEYTNLEEDKDLVKVKIGKLERGKYTAYFSCRNYVDDVFTRTVTFYVD